MPSTLLLLCLLLLLEKNNRQLKKKGKREKKRKKDSTQVCMCREEETLINKRQPSNGKKGHISYMSGLLVLFVKSARRGGIRMECIENTSEGLEGGIGIEDFGLEMHSPSWKCRKASVICFGSGAFGVRWNAEAGELELELMEDEIMVERVEICSFCEGEKARQMPNPPSRFQIQNACGAWNMGYCLDLKSAMKPIMKTMSLNRKLGLTLTKQTKKKVMKALRMANLGCLHQETVHSISCTFVLSPNLRQVDFRGVRRYSHMLEDWLRLLGNRNAKVLEEYETTCSMYMVLLKSNLGYCVELNNDINYVYMQTIGGWEHARYGGTVGGSGAQVCDVLQLIDIQWDYALWSAAGYHHRTVRKGTTTVEISRKGGVVMRVVFPKNTKWNEEAEKELLESCDLLWTGLRKVLSGMTNRLSPHTPLPPC